MIINDVDTEMLKTKASNKVAALKQKEEQLKERVRITRAKILVYQKQITAIDQMEQLMINAAELDTPVQ